MVRTNNYDETVEYLMQRAKGETECKDNRWFIDEHGRIIGHGYIQQGSLAYFPKTPAGSIEISVSRMRGINDEDMKSMIEHRVLNAIDAAKIENERMAQAIPSLYEE